MSRSGLEGPRPAQAARHAHTGHWAAGVLRERISEGQLRPGAKLSELAVAETLGVSRNTLREAFTTLAAESIICRVPNRGVYVSSPDADDVREIYRTRRMIEPAAVLWGELTEELSGRLGTVVERATAARAAADVPGMADANQLLHRTIIASSGSTTLATVMERILARMRLVFHGMADAPDFHTHYVGRNLELVRLLQSGQRQAATELLRGYLDDAEAELLGHLGSAHPARHHRAEQHDDPVQGHAGPLGEEDQDGDDS